MVDFLGTFKEQFLKDQQNKNRELIEYIAQKTNEPTMVDFVYFINAKKRKGGNTEYIFKGPTEL